MTTIGHAHAIPMSVPPPTPDVLHAARLVVAAHAHDTDDLRCLLSMLGLDGTRGR